MATRASWATWTLTILRAMITGIRGVARRSRSLMMAFLKGSLMWSRFTMALLVCTVKAIPNNDEIVPKPWKKIRP